MGGSRKHHAIGRKEYHSVSRLILGGLLRKLKSLFESKSGFKNTSELNTNIFYPEPAETMNDKYNGACTLAKRSA